MVIRDTSRVQPNKLARVTKVLGRTGFQGQCIQVHMLVDGRRYSIICSMKGPVHEGDVLTLLESARNSKVARTCGWVLGVWIDQSAHGDDLQ